MYSCIAEHPGARRSTHDWVVAGQVVTSGRPTPDRRQHSPLAPFAVFVSPPPATHPQSSLTQHRRRRRRLRRRHRRRRRFRRYTVSAAAAVTAADATVVAAAVAVRPPPSLHRIGRRHTNVFRLHLSALFKCFHDVYMYYFK